MHLQVFNYEKNHEEEQSLTAIKIDNQIWFIAKEICNMLGYSNPRDAIRRHCKEKGVVKRDIPTPGGLQEMAIISRGNVNRLITKSKLPAAELYEEWIFDEVLPALQDKGTYTIIPAAPRPKPAFLSLYYNNMHTMPLGGFTVGHMTFHLLYVRLIAHNHRIADAAPDGTRIRPDRSISPRFQRYLDRHYQSVAHLHKPIRFRDVDSNHQEQTVKLYDNLLLTIFVNYFENVWLKEVAPDYFRGKDDSAILAIERLIAVPAPKQIGYTSALKQSA